MKEKIIIFIAGLLLGAVISTTSIYIYTVANNKNTNNIETREFQGRNFQDRLPNDNGTGMPNRMNENKGDV